MNQTVLVPTHVPRDRAVDFEISACTDLPLQWNS